MPRFKKETFHAKNRAGTALKLDVEINISADGEFYANLPEEYKHAFADQVVFLSGRSGKTAAGCFKVVAKTFDALKAGIQNGLQKYLEPEITETPVIRYNIESHVAFAEDQEGNIYPNAGFPGACWNHDHRKLYGDHHATHCAKGGYSLIIGAKAMLKVVTKHGNNERVDYKLYYAGGHHLGRENPAELLNSWTSMELGEKPKEIPYSDKAALFFHRLMMTMALLNKKIQLATFDQEALLALIEDHSDFRLLAAPTNSIPQE